MKYFSIVSTFRNPVAVDGETLKELIDEHKAYLQKGFDEGWILVSGPKSKGGGGIIFMKGESLKDAENYFSSDPLKKSGVQDYEIIEFELHDCQPMLKDWFE